MKGMLSLSSSGKLINYKKKKRIVTKRSVKIILSNINLL